MRGRERDRQIRERERERKIPRERIISRVKSVVELSFSRRTDLRK